MFQIKILTVGKSKEPWLQAALAEYEKRLLPYVKLEWVLAKDDSSLSTLCLKEHKPIGLDPKGAPLSSEQFSRDLLAALPRLSLVIGGADGLPKHVPYARLWSLSPLTFTHQLTRLILLEQVYRAFQIADNRPYHRG
jgi:23S rRNA (pseudouridine1915-N3)-methyltransferase